MAFRNTPWARRPLEHTRLGQQSGELEGPRGEWSPPLPVLECLLDFLYQKEKPRCALVNHLVLWTFYESSPN